MSDSNTTSGITEGKLVVHGKKPKTDVIAVSPLEIDHMDIKTSLRVQN